MTGRRMVLRSVVVLALLGTSAGWLLAQGFGSPRQYYSPWQKHPKHNYHFRRYYFKPNVGFAGYRHHYVIHHPGRPKHAFFFNPYKKAYWGRCELDSKGKAEYSMLPEEHRKGTLAEIPESAFPKPSPVPPIPESGDDIPMDLPPDDLPSEADLAPAA